ncbi:hypothetical protein NHX12_002483, partial [Muraenolepis orangiensis]
DERQITRTNSSEGIGNCVSVVALQPRAELIGCEPLILATLSEPEHGPYLLETKACTQVEEGKAIFRKVEENRHLTLVIEESPPSPPGVTLLMKNSG